MSRLGLIGILCCLVLVVGCQSEESTATPTETPAELSTPVVRPDEMVESVNDTGATVEARQLVLWIPESLFAPPDSNAGGVWAGAVTQFEQAHPALRVETLPKAEEGSANLIHYLRSAQKVAPSILPDVVLVDTQDLWQLTEIGLTQPLSVSTLMQMADFYEFAVISVTSDGQVYGVPFATDVVHWVADTSGQAENAFQPFRTWDDLLSRGSGYLIPVGGREDPSNLSLLAQYTGAGGELSESGPGDDADALLALLQFYTDARDAGVFPSTVLELTTLDSVWSAFVDGVGVMADVRAHTFLSQRELMGTTAFGPLPTRTGEPYTVARTWAFAILTQDPQQRALALELIERLLDPTVHGPWSQFSHYLPSTRSTFQTWPSGQPYIDFIAGQLEIAVSIPNSRQFVNFATGLHAAQQAVLSGSASPEEALLELRATP